MHALCPEDGVTERERCEEHLERMRCAEAGRTPNDVSRAVARAREGVGSHSGFTVISAPGAAAGRVKPQVGPTWVDMRLDSVLGSG